MEKKTMEETKLINNCPKCGLDLVERESCRPICTEIECKGIILSNQTLREWALNEKPKQERMYSEEEVEQFIYYVMVGGLLTLREWKDKE